MVLSTFSEYLQQRTDDSHVVSDYLEEGPAAAEVRRMNESAVNDRLKAGPADLVFREKPSRVRRTAGKEVHW